MSSQTHVAAAILAAVEPRLPARRNGCGYLVGSGDSVPTPGGKMPPSTCVCEDMMTTGASPSPGATCSTREPDGYCVAARRGGELPEGNDPSQTVIPMKVNSIRPARRTSRRRNGEVCAARHTSSPDLPRYPGTGRGGRVFGVGRVGRHHGISKETRAGARRERCGSQSRHSSCEASNDRGDKGGRKMKA